MRTAVRLCGISPAWAVFPAPTGMPPGPILCFARNGGASILFYFNLPLFINGKGTQFFTIPLPCQDNCRELTS